MSDGRTLGRATIGEAHSEPDVATQLLEAANGLEPDARVLTLAGVARSGKTAAMLEFGRRLEGDSFVVSLSETQTSVVAFVSALTQAMSPVARAAQLSLSTLQTRLAGAASFDTIVAWLRSHIDVDGWILIDNVELFADDANLREFLAALVRACSRVRWLFAGRTLQALPLEAWLPYGIAGAPLISGLQEHAPLTRLLGRLDDNERDLLRTLAPMRSLEPRVVDAILGEAGTLLVRGLHQRSPALFEIGAPLRLHRDIQHALLEDLRGEGLSNAIERCGTALEAFEYYDDVLQMYLRMGAHDRLTSLLSARGLALADDVNVDTLDAAARTAGLDSPGVLSLQAILASRRGHVDVAENLFEKALQHASEPVAAQIRYAFGCDLLRRNRAESVTIFERLLDESVRGAAHQSEIRSALAHAHVVTGRSAAALEQIKFALHVLPQSPAIEAVVKARAAYVYLHATHDLALAERIASDALAQALGLRSYTVALAAASIMHEIAALRDRPKEAVAALELVADCAIKAGNVPIQTFAVRSMLEYHVEASDNVAIQASIEALRAFDSPYESLDGIDALTRSEAMQRSWRGDFVGAYHLLAASAPRSAAHDARLLREAQLAFYAAGGDRAALVREHLSKAAALFEGVEREHHHAVRASILLALAASAIGDAAVAARYFESTRDSVLRFPRLAYVREGAHLLHRLWEGEAVEMELRDAFARMHERDAGGFALSFAQFPMTVAVRARAATLRERGLSGTLALHRLLARYPGGMAYE